MIGKTALLQKRGPKNLVTCTACQWYCQIPPGFTGTCGVRFNHQGKLRLLVHSWPTSACLDPIEKKPLYHFLPGTQIFSLGTLGCNFSCQFCQNWQISQTPKHLKTQAIKSPLSNYPHQLEGLIKKTSTYVPPQQIVSYCLKNRIPSIAFTYNEPTIFAEYAYDTMKLAQKHGIYGVFVSSGYESKETLDLLDPCIDAYNIDLKGATEDFYWNICRTHLKPVLDTIKELYRRGKWLEITTLLIPGLNTQNSSLEFIVGFVKSLSPSIPWHVSAFYPAYQLTDTPPTTYSVLKKAYDIGKKAGLKFVYTGNLPHSDTESTYCPNCQKLLISRRGYSVSTENFDSQKGQCPECDKKIPGVWKPALNTQTPKKHLD